MKKNMFIAVIVAATGISAFGQTSQDLQTQLRDIDSQMMALRQTAMQSPDVQTKRQAMMDVAKAYDAALADVPEIKAIDKQMAELRVKMTDIMQQRAKVLQSKDSQLSAVKQARDRAASDLRDATMGGEQAKALMQRRTDLLRSATTGLTGNSVPTPNTK